MGESIIRHTATPWHGGRLLTFALFPPKPPPPIRARSRASRAQCREPPRGHHQSHKAPRRFPPQHNQNANARGQAACRCCVVALAVNSARQQRSDSGKQHAGDGGTGCHVCVLRQNPDPGGWSPNHATSAAAFAGSRCWVRSGDRPPPASVPFLSSADFFALQKINQPTQSKIETSHRLRKAGGVRVLVLARASYA